MTEFEGDFYFMLYSFQYFPFFPAMSTYSFYFILFYFIFCFLGLHAWYMEVPRLGVESELQLPGYAMATATPGLSQIFDLHQSSWQCQILKPLSEARDPTCILMDTSWAHYC